MKDLKFEQKRSLSRTEAADQLDALAAALREGGDAELELDPWKLSLRVPDDLRSEIEVEVSDGEIELEIELTWQTSSSARPPSPDSTAKRAAAKRTAVKRTAAKRTAAQRSTAKKT